MEITKQFLNDLKNSQLDQGSLTYLANLKFLLITFSSEVEESLKNKINEKLAEKLRNDPNFKLHSTCQLCHKSRNPKVKEINAICDSLFAKKLTCLDDTEVTLYSSAISTRDQLAHNANANLGNIGIAEIERLIAVGEKILFEIASF